MNFWLGRVARRVAINESPSPLRSVAFMTPCTCSFAKDAVQQDDTFVKGMKKS